MTKLPERIRKLLKGGLTIESFSSPFDGKGVITIRVYYGNISVTRHFNAWKECLMNVRVIEREWEFSSRVLHIVAKKQEALIIEMVDELLIKGIGDA